MQMVRKWACDDEGQGVTHKCVGWFDGFCGGMDIKPDCPKRTMSLEYAMKYPEEYREYRTSSRTTREVSK